MGVRTYAKIVSEGFVLDFQVKDWLDQLKSYKSIKVEFISREAAFDAMVWLEDTLNEDDYFDVRSLSSTVAGSLDVYFFFTYYEDLIQFKFACL